MTTPTIVANSLLTFEYNSTNQIDNLGKTMEGVSFFGRYGENKSRKIYSFPPKLLNIDFILLQNLQGCANEALKAPASCTRPHLMQKTWNMLNPSSLSWSLFKLLG